MGKLVWYGYLCDCGHLEGAHHLIIGCLDLDCDCAIPREEVWTPGVYATPSAAELADANCTPESGR